MRVEWVGYVDGDHLTLSILFILSYVKYYHHTFTDVYSKVVPTIYLMLAKIKPPHPWGFSRGTPVGQNLIVDSLSILLLSRNVFDTFKIYIS